MTTWLALVAALAAGVVAGAAGVTWFRRGSPDQGNPNRNTNDELSNLQAAFNALPVGVVVVDGTGTVLVRNHPATTLGGALHSDVLLEEAIESQLATARRGDARRQTLDLHGPPRQVLVVSARPLAEGGAMAMVEDVTERARVDAVRTDFVANISHELRTPVGALAILAETLSEADEPEVIDRLSRKMVEEAHRVARTIDDLLELSRIELGGQALREQVDAVSIVEGAIDRVRPFADRRRIEIERRLPTGQMFVLGDRRQLVSAVGNLLENALKYSEAGQRVVLTLSWADPMVRFVVTDDGVGIPARDLDRVFERFYRVDRARSRDTGGTGLGLAIVRHVATNHGGVVTVTSQEGEGSTFALAVPGNQSSDQGARS